MSYILFSGVYSEEIPSRFSVFGLPGQNGPYPFFLSFSLKLDFLPSNGYVYMLTEPPALFKTVLMNIDFWNPFFHTTRKIVCICLLHIL